MARVNGGVESKISGMIGPVVFVNFNGGTYVRQAPRTRGKNSWSSDQVRSRKRFSEVCSFWRKSIPVSVKQVWNLAAEKMNGFNLFLKINLPAFGADGTLADMDRFHFSQGILPLPHKLQVTRISGADDKISVNWQNDSGNGFALPNDELVMITTAGMNFLDPIPTGATRKQETAVISLKGNLNPINGIFLYFKSKERNLYSIDQFFGI